MIRHEQNRGVGAAIVTGYHAALADHADAVVVMAGDAQMDPADLPALLGPVLAGQADYTKGNRFRSRERRNMPVLRRWAGKVLSWATRLASGLQVDDCQCGYTAISRHALCTLPLGELWHGFGYPNDLLLLAAQHGLRVSEVTVACNPDGTVHWTATVSNSGPCTVTNAQWAAVLETRIGGGSFHPVKTQRRADLRDSPSFQEKRAKSAQAAAS